jgi:hypothetical protein
MKIHVHVPQVDLIYMGFSKASRHRSLLEKMLSDVGSSHWQGSFFSVEFKVCKYVIVLQKNGVYSR